LLRQNNISFDPIHSDTATEKIRLDAESDHELERQEPEPGRADSVPSTTLESETRYGAKYVPSSINHLDSTDVYAETFGTQ
jgi:hypothetical protein